MEIGKFVFIKGTSTYSPMRIGKVLLKNEKRNEFQSTKYWVMVRAILHLFSFLEFF